jgi:phosphohistidine phosphatase
MKTLFLLRHAKSSRDDPTLRDFDRPLNDRGKHDAELLGSHLGSQHEFLVDAAISSPARRARQTTEIFLKAAKFSLKPAFDDRIYEAGVQQLLTVVAEIDPARSLVLLVGHNPGFEELVASLTGQTIRLPTAAFAELEFSIDRWRDVRPRIGKLRWLLTPKDLKS